MELFSPARLSLSPLGLLGSCTGSHFMNKIRKKKKVFRWNFMLTDQSELLWNSFLEYCYLWLFWSRIIFLFLNIISFNNAVFLILTCYFWFFLFLAMLGNLQGFSSWPEMEPCLQQWQHRVLISGPLERSLWSSLYQRKNSISATHGQGEGQWW